MTPRPETSSIGGLSHLVEAATALSQLVESGTAQQITKPQESLCQGSQLSNTTTTTNGNTATNNTAGVVRSVVSDDDDDTKKSRKAASTTPRSPREIFPQRLMAILADTTLTDIISWLPHGRSFVIIRPDVFSEQVLPKYFPSTDARSSTKYPSFTRKLNRWGFRQATRGPDTGAFHHPLFRRDQPTLCLDMVCQKSRKRPIKKKAEVNAEKKKGNTAVDEAVKSGPLKKRKLEPTLTSESLAALSASAGKEPSPAAAPSTVSADDRSVSSNSTSDPASNFLPNGQALSSWVPNDPALVAATLRTREEIEKITVAKSMLYDAYLKALGGQ